MSKLKVDPEEQELFRLDAPVRRRAGHFLREKSLRKTFIYSMIGALLIGFGTALATLSYAVNLSSSALIQYVGILVMVFAVLLLSIVAYSRGNWSLQNIQKGLAGEVLIGDISERALLKSCGLFVAHDVHSSTSAGNIDHLVATPTKVLVVETKYQYLPKQSFARTLQAIRRKAENTKRFLQLDSHVIGCLVLARETKPIKKTRYTVSGTTVYVLNTEKYEEFLLKLGKGDRTLPPNVYKKIEELAFHPDDI